jgi:hypothetical protein
MRNGVTTVAVAVAITLRCVVLPAAGQSQKGKTMKQPTTSARKLFVRLRGGTRDGAVVLRFYMSTPLFRAPAGKKRGLKIRVYRREERAFVFGEDYEEYFDGLSMGGAEKIFQGTLPAINGRKFEFTDKTVKRGKVYVYWVSSTRGDPPAGPAAVKVRDPEVWWPAETVQARVAALAKTYPELVTLRVYGRTVRGRPLKGVVAGRGTRCLALVGAIHAGESGPELILPAIERLLKENSKLLHKVRVAALPSVNMDERERLARGTPWYLRTNANGVDLNRNFDADWQQVDRGYGLLTSDPDSATYRGPSAASEPETSAVVEFMREVRPAAVFSYHHLASIAGCVFLAPKAAKGDKAYAKQCLTSLTPYTRGYHGDRRRTGRMSFGCSAGSFPAWAYRHGTIPCFDVEADVKQPAEKASCKDRTTRAMLREYQDRHYRAILAVLEMLAGSAKKGVSKR